MKKLLLAVTAIAAMLATMPAYALTFDFSFTNTIGKVSGTVTGEIDGLIDNMANQAATHVFVDSYPTALGLGIATPFDTVGTGTLFNSFTVMGGAITAEHFWSQSNPWDLYLTSSLSGGLGCPQSFPFCLADTNNGNAVIGTTLTTAPTPLPAALPLFVTGLGGLGLLGWRRKRKARATS